MVGYEGIGTVNTIPQHRFAWGVMSTTGLTRNKLHIHRCTSQAPAVFTLEGATCNGGFRLAVFNVVRLIYISQYHVLANNKSNHTQDNSPPVQPE